MGLGVGQFPHPWVSVVHGSPAASPVGTTLESVSPASDSWFCVCAGPERGGAPSEHPKATAAVTDRRAQGQDCLLPQEQPRGARLGPRARLPAQRCRGGRGENDPLGLLRRSLCTSAAVAPVRPPLLLRAGTCQCHGWGEPPGPGKCSSDPHAQDGFRLPTSPGVSERTRECTPRAVPMCLLRGLARAAVTPPRPTPWSRASVALIPLRARGPWPTA